MTTSKKTGDGKSNDKELKVLYICGLGRSGSTLLDLMLGQLDGFFSVGELLGILEEAFSEQQLCGCGTVFKNCEFWTEVGDAIGINLHPSQLQSYRELRLAVNRIRHIPLLMLPPMQRPSAYQVAWARYAEFLGEFYSGIKEVSGCRIIVDSSKSPLHGLMMSTVPGVDLHVLHLVRDSRAVAYSWGRKKAKPEIYWRAEQMPQFGPVVSALKWDLANVLSHLLGLITKNYMLLRYEDLVNKPQRILSGVLTSLGETAILGSINDTGFVPKVNHTISGNPLRFQTGRINVQADEEWRQNMSTCQKLVVSAITWPLLLCYVHHRPTTSK